MLTIATFFWQKDARGFQLPSVRGGFSYGPEHVRRLQAGLARHAGPHRFVCITDQPIEGVECLPLWPDLAELGGCYRRLKVFEPGIREMLGPRFMLIDLDCVIVRDLQPLLARNEAVIFNAYRPLSRRDPDQFYNGGLMLMDAGARPQVWESFDPIRSPQKIARARLACIGTDQAWIRLTLGKGEARFTEADGVYEFRQVRDRLPANARLVLFAGARDPSTLQEVAWVRRHWQ